MDRASFSGTTMTAQLTRRSLLHSTAAALGAASLGGIANAQVWPSKGIRIVCGFPAGGYTDLITRAFGEHLASRLGQTVIVENKAGAGGGIAAQAVKLAPADGYTLMTTISTTMFSNRV